MIQWGIDQTQGADMNDDFNKYMQMIAGQSPQKSGEQQLSDADKKKLSDAYFELFFNLSAINWLRGGNLGHAWYAAMAQMKSYTKSKNANNPASMYIRQIFAAHNARWSQIMMTNPHRDDIIDAPTEKRQEWLKRVSPKVSDMLKTLNETIAVYNVNDDKNKNQSGQNITQNAYTDAAKRMQMMILMRMREHVRENGRGAA